MICYAVIEQAVYDIHTRAGQTVKKALDKRLLWVYNDNMIKQTDSGMPKACRNFFMPRR
nr:MAG TPA: hypothetical protein [Caudoviricetes sp.]